MITVAPNRQFSRPVSIMNPTAATAITATVTYTFSRDTITVFAGSHNVAGTADRNIPAITSAATGATDRKAGVNNDAA